MELRLGHEIETYSNRVDQLKRALALKDKELNHVRSLASVIVSQRTETEKFFVDALAEVKAEIAAKRPPEPARKVCDGDGDGDGGGDDGDGEWGWRNISNLCTAGQGRL